MDFSNEKFGNNYAIIYKREGKDPTELKIDKPQITPIATNRDASSAFVKEIQNSEVTPVEPVFLNFDKDMKNTKSQIEYPGALQTKCNERNFQPHLCFRYGKQ